MSGFYQFRLLALGALIIFGASHVAAQQIQIGFGSELHAGLPTEPIASYSFSQQIFKAAEITTSGEIHRLSFEYHITSDSFLSTSGTWRIYLEDCSLNVLEGWVNPGAINPVFEGNLSIDFFDSGIPGSGWLTIPLQSPFYYDGARNLLLSVYDHSGQRGYSGDDFYCFASSGSLAINYLSLDNPLDFANLPPPNPKAWRSNLILGFGAQPDAPQNLYGYYFDAENLLFWQAPPALAVDKYLVYRNGQSYGQSSTCSFADAGIVPGESYLYKVQARFTDGSFSGFSNEISITVPPPQQDYQLYENFEEIPAFSAEIPGWENYDLNAAPKWSWQHTDFPGNGAVVPWLVFAPAECTPPLTNISPVSGQNILMAAASMLPPNNDWLVSPRVLCGENATLSFMARSYTVAYGLERLRVLLCTAADAKAENFTPLHSEEYLLLPAAWQEYSFDLSAYAGQSLCIALNCVSLDAMALLVDDIILASSTGNPAADALVSPLNVKSYPNPALKGFKLESDALFSAKIYNLRGQLLDFMPPGKSYDSSALKLPAGLYFIQIQQNQKLYTLKQVILP